MTTGETIIAFFLIWVLGVCCYIFFDLTIGEMLRDLFMEIEKGKRLDKIMREDI